MATKRTRRLDARAYRLEHLARRLRDEFGQDARALPVDDWVRRVHVGPMVVQCHPTDPDDPDRPWYYTVDTRNGANEVEIASDLVTPEMTVQVKGGNIPEAALRIARLAADRRSAATMAV